MSEFATYFENAIVNLMRNTAFTEVAVYVALFTDSASTAELEAGTLTVQNRKGTFEVLTDDDTSFLIRDVENPSLADVIRTSFMSVSKFRSSSRPPVSVLLMMPCS